MMEEEESPISEEDICKIISVLADIAGAESSLPVKRQMLIQEIANLIEADYATWVLGGTMEDNVPTSTVFLQTGFSDAGLARYLEVQEHPDITYLSGQFVEAMMQKKGHVTRLSQQMTPMEEVRKSDIFPKLVAADLGCALLSGTTTSSGQSSILSFFRSVEKPEFSERDARIAHILLSEVRWLHDTAWPHHPKEGITALRPRQRTVLSLLINGRNRKEISADLEISPHTVNDYVSEIYQAFSVNSHTELIRRFLVGDKGDEVEE